MKKGYNSQQKDIRVLPGEDYLYAFTG